MEAVALFGSQVSGGSDNNSDRDLLVVCPPNEKQLKIREFTTAGYGVSAYTPQQLEYMKDKGSLFLQHLKYESKILHDNNGNFEKFLKSCTLIPPSDLEIAKTVNTILYVLAAPRTGSLSLWLEDYLYVLSRDFLIKYFAKRGKVVFNVNHLSESMANEFNISNNEVVAFGRLRHGKYLYRNGFSAINHSTISLQRWTDAIIRITDCKKTNVLSKNNYLNYHADNSFISNYHLLRYIESLRILFPTVAHETTNDKKLELLIKNPNQYSSTSANSVRYLKDYLKIFRKKANKFLHNPSDYRSTFVEAYAEAHFDMLSQDVIYPSSAGEV